MMSSQNDIYQTHPISAKYQPNRQAGELRTTKGAEDEQRSWEQEECRKVRTRLDVTSFRS